MGQNSIISLGRSPPQELEAGPRSGPYLLVYMNLQTSISLADLSLLLEPAAVPYLAWEVARGGDRNIIYTILYHFVLYMLYYTTVVYTMIYVYIYTLLYTIIYIHNTILNILNYTLYYRVYIIIHIHYAIYMVQFPQDGNWP